MPSPKPIPIISLPSAAEHLPNVAVRNRLRASVTGGAGYVVEFDLQPEALTSMHAHLNDDETMYVVRGQLNVVLENGEHLEAPTGSVIHLPKGSVHALHNPSKTDPGTYIVFVNPGVDLESFFDELEAALDNPDVDPATLDAVQAKNNILKKE
jgi:quercetin dioxygenase-like cupin family protein